MDRAQTDEPAEQFSASIKDGTAVEAIAFAVAEVEGVSPTDLNPPLHDVIDPDVLDWLFIPGIEGSGDPACRVVFPYRGHMVTYSADGYATVEPGAAP